MRLHGLSFLAAGVFGLSIAVGAVGCDDDSGAAKPDGGSTSTDGGTLDAAVALPPATEAEFCQRKAEVECGALLPRCGGSANACQQARNGACLVLAGQQRVGMRVYKPGNVAACLAGIASALADISVSSGEWKQMRDICNRVWEGSGSPVAGSLCTSAYECFAEFACDKGRCATPVVKGRDELCNNPGEICGPGQSCVNKGAVAQCVDRGFDGHLCSAQQPCEPELRCGKAGMCEEKAPFGAACTRDEECRTGLCDPFMARCQVTVILSSTGPACAGLYAGADSTPLVAPDGGTMMTVDAGVAADAAAGKLDAGGRDAASGDSSTD